MSALVQMAQCLTVWLLSALLALVSISLSSAVWLFRLTALEKMA
jgi:hypothetical protein